MRCLATLCCMTALFGATACNDPIQCPGDLVRDGVGGCACPAGFEARPTPITLQDGASDFCLDSEVPVGRGVKDAGSAPSDARAAHDASVGGPAGPSDTSQPSPGPAGTANTPPGAADPRTDAGSPAPTAVSPTECAMTPWYRDCDGDGYAADRSGAASGCSTPPPPSDCRGWTRREPILGQVDCDDDSIAYTPGADFGTVGVGDGDLNCDGVIERKVEALVAPSVVERKPRDDAKFCRYDADQRRLDCECFHWDPTTWQGEALPPCALALSDRIEASYVAFDGSGTDRRCSLAVTFATMSIDTYQVRQLCR